MSAWRRSQPSSGAWKNVLIGTATAPMRVAARNATKKSGPLGASTPTRVPLTTPSASSVRASSAERASASAYVMRSMLPSAVVATIRSLAPCSATSASSILGIVPS